MDLSTYVVGIFLIEKIFFQDEMVSFEEETIGWRGGNIEGLRGS